MAPAPVVGAPPPVVVAAPPVGTVVAALPAGDIVTDASFNCGVYYRAFYQNNQVVYRVLPGP